MHLRTGTSRRCLWWQRWVGSGTQGRPKGRVSDISARTCARAGGFRMVLETRRTAPLRINDVRHCKHLVLSRSRRGGRLDEASTACCDRYLSKPRQGGSKTPLAEISRSAARTRSRHRINPQQRRIPGPRTLPYCEYFALRAGIETPWPLRLPKPYIGLLGAARDCKTKLPSLRVFVVNGHAAMMALSNNARSQQQSSRYISRCPTPTKAAKCKGKVLAREPSLGT